MALFKISKGTSQNLPSTLTEGYCWYTYNNSKFYIDFKDENGVLTRKALNAQEAEKITGYDIATILNSSDVEIPTSKAVLDAIDAYRAVADPRIDTIEGKLATINNGAQVNVLESITLNGVAQEIKDKSVNIPLATNTILGLVMGSSAENKVSIAEDGTMEVNSLNINKLVQTPGDSLVLMGGSSNINI